MLDREADQARAMEITAPILGGLYSVMDESVTFYFDNKNYSVAARADHTNTAVANNIYSHAEKRAAVLAEITDGLSVISVKSMRVANYRDQGLFRFKRVKANGKPALQPC